MSHLCVFHSSNTRQPIKLLNHSDDIVRELAEIGVRFEQRQVTVPVTGQSTGQEIVTAYQAEIDSLEAAGFHAVDVINVDEQHPQKEQLRSRFVHEHTHAEDEACLFVAGRGLFNFHVDDHVYAVLCEKGDLIVIPAGIKRWFDMGEHPRFAAIRLFGSEAGKERVLTGADVASRYPDFSDY